MAKEKLTIAITWYLELGDKNSESSALGPPAQVSVCLHTVALWRLSLLVDVYPRPFESSFTQWFYGETTV